MLGRLVFLGKDDGEWINPSSRAWALAAVIGGIALLLGVEVIDQPDATALDLLLELINITPIVMTSVGVVLLFQVAQRQRDDQAQLIRDLESPGLRASVGAPKPART